MELDFSKMKWPIHEVPLDKELLVFFPELHYIFAEHIKPIREQGLNINTVIRYIIYNYHKNSPFVIKIDDLTIRKKMSIQKAGVEPKDGIIPEEWQEVLTHGNEQVCHAIIQFTKFENNIRHMALMLQTEAYYNWSMELVKATTKSSDLKNRASIVNQLKILRQEIDTLSAQSFHGDTDLLNFVGSAKVVTDRIIFPEDYVANRKAERKEAAGVAAKTNPPVGD